MSDKIPKATLEEYYNIHSVELEDIGEDKKMYNEFVMQNEKQANAILQIEIDELKFKLYEKEKEYNSIKQSCDELKKENEQMKINVLAFNDIVNDHLDKVIKELCYAEKNNESIIDKFVNKLSLQKIIRKTREIQHEIEKY